jgi:hypothetical protein
MINELINELKERLLQGISLEVICYFFIKNDVNRIHQISNTEFTGEVETVAYKSFSNEYEDTSELEKIKKRISNNSYRGLNIYHYIGLSYQDKLHNNSMFKNILEEYFDKHSIRYKYLISKVFNEFESKFKLVLQKELDTQDDYFFLLQHLYVGKEMDKAKVLQSIQRKVDSLDCIDLLALEDLRDIQNIGYNKVQDNLMNDIIWASTEIQSKHKILNNNEDQYNSLFQSLLSAKGYLALDQTQRGQSNTSVRYGELDVAIFTKEKLPLSILEAFVIDSVDSDYITKHIKKLSENYDPNGLKNNYAIVYAKNNKFDDFWKRYKEFIITIDYKYSLLNNTIEDITSQFPQYAGIRLGLTKHNNGDVIVSIYHIFMDMNFVI